MSRIVSPFFGDKQYVLSPRWEARESAVLGVDPKYPQSRYYKFADGFILGSHPRFVWSGSEGRPDVALDVYALSPHSKECARMDWNPFGRQDKET